MELTSIDCGCTKAYNRVLNGDERVRSQPAIFKFGRIGETMKTFKVGDRVAVRGNAPFGDNRAVHDIPRYGTVVTIDPLVVKLDNPCGIRHLFYPYQLTRLKPKVTKTGPEEVWVNIYPNRSDISGSYLNKTKADKSAAYNRLACLKYIRADLVRERKKK